MIFVVALIFLGGAAQLVVSNRLANLGEQIEIDRAKTDTLALENQLLEEEVRSKESLSAISQEAKELGFVDAKSVYYLVPQIPVAANIRN